MIRVLGVGNALMSDDGLGPYVVRVLEAFYEFPADVEVIDVGTPGLDLTPYLLNAVATGVTLSAAVQRAVAPVVSLVLNELEALGVRPISRPVPRTAHIWWDSHPSSVIANPEIPQVIAE